jgi:hypothetical protein
MMCFIFLFFDHFLKISLIKFFQRTLEKLQDMKINNYEMLWRIFFARVLGNVDLEISELPAGDFINRRVKVRRKVKITLSKIPQKSKCNSFYFLTFFHIYI